MSNKDSNHAIDNAKAWLASIVEMVGKLTEAEQNPDDNDTLDKARQAITESVLDLQVRSEWHQPGAESEPSEFLILLTTGGPALRIVGELNAHNEPENPRLEYQDWGIPWTSYSIPAGDEWDAINTFCQQFYFGE